MREIFDAFAPRLPYRHGVGRRRSFESHGKKYYLLVGIGFCDLQTIERRIDDAHVGALGFDGEEIGLGAGHAQHVAEGGKNHVGTPRNRVSLIDHL